MTPHPDDTIVALSSAAGPGRRAVVRVSGPGTRAAVGRVFEPGPTGFCPSPVGGGVGEGSGRSTPPRPLPLRERGNRHLVPGVVRLTGVPAPVPAELYLFAAPRSYTGQDVAELHLVSSPPLVERLIADLLAAGGRPARPGEFTLRAFLAGKKDLAQAEAVRAVIEAGTDAELKPALAELAGGVARPLDRVRGDLLDLLADVEAGLDFVAEDIEFVSTADVLARTGAAAAAVDALARQLDDRGVSGRPPRAAVVGRPNAGKSSLFNALAGGGALVGPAAGTTRDYLRAALDLGGVRVELIDTAGWAAAADGIEEQAQRLGREQAGRADLLLWCVPVGEEPDAADAARLAATGIDVLRVRTKADLSASPAAAGEVPASVVAPDGTAAVRRVLRERAEALARPSAAPAESRCRHHVEAAAAALRRAAAHAAAGEPAELLALELRTALDQIGETAGAVYTDDLLDRVFSRFCIGK